MTDVLFVDDVIRSDEMLQKIRLLQDDLFPIKYGDDFYARLKQKEILIACAMIGEEVIGCVTARFITERSWFFLFDDSTELYVMTLCTRRTHQKRGVASELLRRIAVLAQLHSPQPQCSSITLHVKDLNVAAKRFYKKNGFRQDDVLIDHYRINGVYYDALFLRKRLPLPSSNSITRSDQLRDVPSIDWMSRLMSCVVGD